MLRVCFTLLIFIIFFQSSSHITENFKPSFYPYCRSEKKCSLVCDCKIYPSCILQNMDDRIRGKILNYHNQIRSLQTPTQATPAAMTLLEYDMELEEISICWAARCEDVYSDCFFTPRFSETSQSVIQVVLKNDQRPNVDLWMQITEEWIVRLKDLSVEFIEKLPDGDVEGEVHNSIQVISDKIVAIGCAWSALGDIITLVCTYGPRGPKSGEVIYKIGEPCSSCPVNYTCDDIKPLKNLCKPIKNEQDVQNNDIQTNPPILPPLPEFYKTIIPPQVPAPPDVDENSINYNSNSETDSGIPQPPPYNPQLELFPRATNLPVSNETTEKIPMDYFGRSHTVKIYPKFAEINSVLVTIYSVLLVI